MTEGRIAYFATSERHPTGVRLLPETMLPRPPATRPSERATTHHRVFSDDWIQSLALGGNLSTNEVRFGVGMKF